MYRKKLDEDVRCPLEYGIGLLGGKWKSRIICELGNIGPMRFGELRTEMVSITDGVLAGTLAELIREAILTRESAAGSAAHSLYRLTEKGESLIPYLRELCRWSGQYYKDTEGIVMRHCRRCDYYRQWEEENRSEEQENGTPFPAAEERGEPRRAETV